MATPPASPTHRPAPSLAHLAIALLAVVAGLYGLGVGALYVWQSRLIYPAPPGRVAAASLGPAFRDIVLLTSDRLVLHAVYRPARGERRTLVFFHGNGDTLSGAAAATRALGEAGYGLLLVEYRGYAGNPGVADEEGLYRDGRAALGWLQAQRVSADRVVLIGNSLGSGVATQLAWEFPVAGLVIVSGFTSLPDAAAAQLPWVPVRWLLQDRYDNRAKLSSVMIALPVLVLHGEADTLISVAQGRTLAAASPMASFTGFPGIGHDLAYRPPAAAAIGRWLDRLPPPTR